MRRLLIVVLALSLWPVAAYANNPPNACFSVTNNASCGSWTLDASCSTDDNGIVEYDWYIDDTGTVLHYTGQSVTDTFASGPWKVTLRVSDGTFPQGLTDSATACFWVCCVGICGSC